MPLMPSFGRTSRARLDTCHPDLVRLMEAAIEETDFSILCGHRTEAEQNALSSAVTGKRWPNSRHNPTRSEAVDIAPYPIVWPDRETQTPEECEAAFDRFRALARVVVAARAVVR